MNKDSFCFCPLRCQLSILYGEVAEWSKAHAWKACIPLKGIEGSNPSLSARFLMDFLKIRTNYLLSYGLDIQTLTNN